MKGTQHRKSVKIIALTFDCSLLFLLENSLFLEPASVLDDLAEIALIAIYEIEMVMKQMKLRISTLIVNHL